MAFDSSEVFALIRVACAFRFCCYCLNDEGIKILKGASRRVPSFFAEKLAPFFISLDAFDVCDTFFIMRKVRRR